MQTDLLERLKNLPSGHFQEVMARYGLHPSHVPEKVSQAEQAILLLRYAEQQQDQDYARLTGIIDAIEFPPLPPRPQLPPLDPARPLDFLLAWANTRYRSQQFRLRGRITEFIGSYATRPDNPIPFVGRDESLQALDTWLAQDKQRLLLLSGGAGRGKSALLLHWLARVLARNNLPQREVLPYSVLFFPLSIRFQTANEIDGLRLLHSALCDDFPDLEFPPQAKPDSDDYRDKLAQGWEEIRKRPENRWLLVVDALDEAINGWILREILPREIPPNLLILVSARHKPGHDNGQAWLQDLECQAVAWHKQTTACATILELHTLAQIAMAEAVIQLGKPLDQLADKEDFTAELYRLTDQGDPLLLYLWLVTLWKEHQSRPDLDAPALSQLKPGFSGFFKRWLEDQKSVWQAENLAASRREFEELAAQFTQLLQVLALAHAPLHVDKELTPLLQRLAHPWSNQTLRVMLDAAQRLIARSGEGENLGVTLIHPRLRDYFRDELAQNQPKHLAQLTQAFLDWGADTVARLNSGDLKPEECPPYLLQQYVAHVRAAELPEREALDRHYLPLLQRGWPFAWETYDGAYGGFLDDLKNIQIAIQAWNRKCEPGRRGEMLLSSEIRCELIRCSIFSLCNNLSEKLVVELVRENIWPLRKGLAMAWQFSEPTRQAECLIQLSDFISGKDRCELLKKVIGLTKSYTYDISVYSTLRDIALKNDLCKDVIILILQSVENIEDEWRRAHVLTDISEYFGMYPECVSYAIDIARTIKNDFQISRFISLFVYKTKLYNNTVLFQQALEIIYSISNIINLTDSIILINLRSGEQVDLVSHAFGIIKKDLEKKDSAKNETIYSFLKMILSLCILREKIICNTILDAVGIQKGEYNISLLMPSLIYTCCNIENFPDLLIESLDKYVDHTALDNNINEWMRNLKTSWNEYRYKIFSHFMDILTRNLDQYEAKTLITFLPKEEQKIDLLSKTLDRIENILDEKERSDALCYIAGITTGYENIFNRVIDLAEEIENNSFERDCLICIFNHIGNDKAILARALKITKSFDCVYRQKSALINLSKYLHLHPELFNTSIELARSFENKNDMATALCWLAESLSGHKKHEILMLALNSSLSISDDEKHDNAVSLFSADKSSDIRQYNLPIFMWRWLDLGELKSVENAKNDHEISYIIKRISCRLSYCPDLLERMITITKNIKDERIRIVTLCSLTPYMGNNERTKIIYDGFDVAMSMKYEWNKGKILGELAPYLADYEDFHGKYFTELDSIDSIGKDSKINAFMSFFINKPTLFSYNYWEKLLSYINPKNRHELLESANHVLFSIKHLTHNEREVVALKKAILDVKQWWP